jgi:hypothetical protein
MKKKRRLPFLVVNLVAILAALGSVFLPWWQGLRPSDVALTKILPFDFINSFGFSPSVVVAVFIGAAVMLLGALLALKLIVLGGAVINTAAVLLWFLAFQIGWQPGRFGHGLYLLAAGILIAVFSLFIPKRRRERKR